MPLLRTYREENLLLGIWKTEETAEQLLAMLSATGRALWEEQTRTFADKRKYEWLAVRVLLKTLCGTEKQVAHQASGKPYLTDRSWHISISHTRGYVAVLLHATSEVGIDIEQYAPKVQRVASRLIRPDEEGNLLSGDKIYALLLHWSAKETLFKLIDREGVDFIRHLRIYPFVQAEQGVLQAREYRTEAQQAYTIHYLTHPHFVLTWAVAAQ